MDIRDVPPHDFPRGVALLSRSLGFDDVDAIPAWLALATGEAGGVALGAYHGRELVGFSYALPALEPDGPHLYSCGLAVAPAWRSRGVARRLKLVQRDRALARGLRRIRWTADPLSVPALRLYLSRLGARLVGYRAGMFDGLRATKGDDVEIEWRLDGGAPAARCVERVENSGCSRGRVRREMTALLETGLVGTSVEIDAGRSWVCFSRP